MESLDPVMSSTSTYQPRREIFASLLENKSFYFPTNTDVGVQEPLPGSGCAGEQGGLVVPPRQPYFTTRTDAACKNI